MKVFSKRTISKLSRQYAVTALHLPDGETLILHANEGTALGDIANTLASEKQMEANGVIVYTDESGRKFIEADGYIKSVLDPIFSGCHWIPARKYF